MSTFALKRSVEFGHRIAGTERFESWAQRTGYHSRDLGVDQGITTTEGEIWAVQNKGCASAAAVPLPEMSNLVLAVRALPNVKRLLRVTSGPGLTANAETRLIAARGTGTTVTSEAIVEALGAKTIVFFVPSVG